MNSQRNRPPHHGERTRDEPAGEAVKLMHEWVSQQVREGLEPRDVGDTVLQAIKDNRFYILTHPDWNPMIETRVRNILSGNNPQTVLPPGAESLVERLTKLSQGRRTQ